MAAEVSLASRRDKVLSNGGHHASTSHCLLTLLACLRYCQDIMQSADQSFLMGVCGWCR